MEYATFKISNKCMILKIVLIQKKTHVNQNMLIHISKKFKIPITQCFCCERLFFSKQLKIVTNKLAQKINPFSQIEMINHTITIHICSNCLNNINKGKRRQYQVPYNISRNKMIPLITKLTHLEECLISS
jgi:hypothetical protein